MVVNRISYHLQNSNWTQIDHELIMNIGGNILHGADLLQNFYSGLSKSNLYSLYCSLISMMFIKNNSLLPHSIWFQIGHDLMMNIGVVILHGANLLQSVFLRSHLPTIFPTKLSSTLNIKPGFSTKSISKMAAVTLDSPSLEDYLAPQPHILEPYISSEIAEIGFLPSIICEPDLNFWKEVLNTHSSPHQARKDCSCYHACQAYLMPDAVNIQPLTSSLRYFDISSEITEVDPLFSLIREQFSKKTPMSAIVLLSVVFPGKIIITSRISYYPQVIFNGYYSLRLPFSMSTSNMRQNQYCIWFTTLTVFSDPLMDFDLEFIPIQPWWQAPSRGISVTTTLTQFLVQHIVLPHSTNQHSPALSPTTTCSYVRRRQLHLQPSQRVLCPFIRPTSWLVTSVTESTNYSASTRDVASDQKIMFSWGCGIHLNSPELLLILSTYWHHQPVCGEFESYLPHVFITRTHNDLALQTKSLLISVSCILYPPDAELDSHDPTSYDLQRHLFRSSQPFSSNLSLPEATLYLPPTVLPFTPSKLYMQSPVKSPGACIPLTPDTVSLPYWQTTLNLLSSFSAHGLVTPVAPAYSTP